MNRLFAETYAKDQEIEARYDATELKKRSSGHGTGPHRPFCAGS